MPAASAPIEELVDANHILFHQGVLDAFGHVSMRHPHEATCFLIARSMAPPRVTVQDVMVLDLDGQPVGDDARPRYLERFIHAEIYRAHPDVGAVVHSHSPALIPFGVSSRPLRPLYHMAGFLRRVPVWDIRHATGRATNMLVGDAGTGRSLAACLRGASALLMRGHGTPVGGGSLRQAVFRAIYTEVNARLQSEALRLGPVTYLNDEEADLASATNDGQINRAWELWKMQAARRPLRAAPKSRPPLRVHGPSRIRGSRRR